MKYSFVLFLIGLVILNEACKKEEIQIPAPAGISESQRLRVDELESIYHPIDDADPDRPFQDLENLDYLGEAKIIGLGEATHGTLEFFEMKDRLFRFLVQDYGFKVFGIEADFAESLYFESYVLGQIDDDISELMADNMHFWTWQTQEVKALLEWMRAYNSDKAPEDKIHYYGFDCQIPVYNVDKLVEHLSPLDAMFADSVEQALKIVRGLGNPQETQPSDWQMEYYNIQWVKDQIEFRANDLAAQSSEVELALIKQLARVVEQCLEVQHAYVDTSIENPRDKYMAENAIWIADHFGEETKMVAWAHNLHINNNTHWESMGKVLRGNLNQAYQVVGFSFSTGNFRAFRNGQGLISNQIESAPRAGSYNEVFHNAESDNFYFTLADLPAESTWQEWMIELPDFLNIGAVYNGSPNSYYFAINLRNDYDVIFYFDNTKAALPL